MNVISSPILEFIWKNNSHLNILTLYLFIKKYERVEKPNQKNLIRNFKKK